MAAPRLARARYEEFDIDDSAETQVFQSAMRRRGGLRVPPPPPSSAVMLRQPVSVPSAAESGGFDVLDAPTAEVKALVPVPPAPLPMVMPPAPLPVIVPPALESTPAMALDALQPAPVPSVSGEATFVGRPAARFARIALGVLGASAAAAAAALLGWSAMTSPEPVQSAFVETAAPQVVAAAALAPAAAPIEPSPAAMFMQDAANAANAAAPMQADVLQADALQADALVESRAAKSPAPHKAARAARGVRPSANSAAAQPASVARAESKPASAPRAESKPASVARAESKPASASRAESNSNVVTAKATARQASRVLDDAL